MANKNFWGYRIDTKNIAFFREELEQGRLRQGWGWHEGQDLRNMTVDEGARRNLAMLQVKKGDILLIPKLPEWHNVAIVEAKEDWDKGYSYEIAMQYGDYGHIFPAKLLRYFTRYSDKVDSGIRTTLRNPSRFWNISYLSDEIEAILAAEESEISGYYGYQQRAERSIHNAFREHFDEAGFSRKLYQYFNKEFSDADWENALVFGLKQLFPFYGIERVGGPAEKEHGTDILIRIPGILPDFGYAIAIQVKDYKGKVDRSAIEQINKADAYYSMENLKLIDKFVIYTGAKKEDNLDVAGDGDDVKLIFAKQLENLLLDIGKRFLGMETRERIGDIMRGDSE